MLEQVFGAEALATVACEPEGIVDFPGSRGAVRESTSNLIEQPECRRIPEPNSCPAFDQPACRVPLGERHGVGQWWTAGDYGAGRFDVSTPVEEGIQNGNVIAARRPVERRFCMGTCESRVDVGPRPNEG